MVTAFYVAGWFVSLERQFREAFEANLGGYVSKVCGDVLHSLHEGGLYCVPESQRRKAGSAKRSPASPTRAGVFKTILSEDVDWKPFPAFPPSVRLAVVVGQPSEPGPYTIRVKAPHGEKLMPHKHPEDRVYTVISGVFYIGLGDEFDASKLEAYPPGAVIILPGNTPHFHWAKSGEYVTQITAMGPLGLEYLSAKDDPRNNNS
jgi:quercetin dioxygenase-like cupin family protein